MTTIMDKYFLNLLTKISTKQLQPHQAFMIQLDIKHITSSLFS